MKQLLAICTSFLIATQLLACGDKLVATQVMVILDAEPGVRAQAEQLHIVVAGMAGQDESASREPYDRIITKNSSDLHWPYLVALTPLGGDAARPYEVVATALDQSDDFVAQVRAISGYVSHRRLELRLLLEESCIGKQDCASDQTCRAGSCRSARIDPAHLPDVMGSTSARDGGARDNNDTGTGGTERDGGTSATDGSTIVSDSGSSATDSGASGGGSGGSGGSDGTGQSDGTGGLGGTGGSMSSDPECGNGVREPGEDCDGTPDCNDQCDLGLTAEQRRCLDTFAKTDEPCARCECITCTQTALDCRDDSDATREQLCVTLSECTRTNACFDMACYCGTALFCTPPSGPCRTEIEAAAGTTDGNLINMRKTDPTYAVGRSGALDTCSMANCATSCF